LGDAVRAHLVFRGRVQGVFFRANTQRVAREEGLVGWVRNLEDGSVEAVVEGERARVEALVERLGREVKGARVDGVEARWEAPRGKFDGFEVRR
jgi:acylphosphatase